MSSVYERVGGGTAAERESRESERESNGSGTSSKRQRTEHVWNGSEWNGKM